MDSSHTQRLHRRQALANSRTFKIIVIGDSGVGKTCLTYRFCTGQFPSKTESTIGVDFRERILDIEGEKIKMQLWDTAGQERFRKSMVQHYYRDAHAAVFVYDISDVSSFRSLPVWLEECRQNLKDAPRVLVGNKADLVPSVSTAAAVVEQGRHLAEVHAMPFHLCSATGGAAEHVDAVFMALAYQLKKQGGRRRRGPAAAAGSFKLPAKAKAESECKDIWTCAC